MARVYDYAYLLATIVFTVYGQIILKWRIQKFAPLPTDTVEKFTYLLSLFLDPIIFSGIFAAFLASLAWMAAITKFELSHAYPFMALNFVIVLLLSGWLLSEEMTLLKVVGTVLILLGTVLATRG